MKTHLPQPIQHYFGYQAELEQLVAGMKERTVGIVSGLPGSGKTELALRASHTLLKSFPLKPALIEFRQAATLKELIQELSPLLPKKQFEQMTGSSLHDQLGELIGETEGRKRWILLENAHFLDEDALLSLIQVALQYFRHSRLLITSRAALRSNPLVTGEALQIELGGIDESSAEKLAAQWGNAPMRLDAKNNPALVKLYAASGGKGGAPSAMEWVSATVPKELSGTFEKWRVWETLPLTTFERLSPELKSASERLLRNHFLVKGSDEVELNPVLRELKSRAADPTVWSELIAASEGTEQKIYRVRAGEAMPEADLLALGRELHGAGRYGAILELQYALRGRGVVLEPLCKLELALAVELHLFDRAEEVAQTWLSNLDAVTDLDVLNSLCSLAYVSRNHEVLTQVTERHFQASAQSGSLLHQAQSSHWKAFVERDKHRYVEARKLRELAVERMKGVPAIPEEVAFEIYFHLGVDCFCQRDFHASIEATRESMKIAESHHMVTQAQKALYNLIVSAEHLGDMVRGRGWMKELKESLAERPQPILEISVGMTDAIWASFENRPVQARTILEALRPIVRRRGSQNQQIALELTIAEMAIKTGAIDAAQTALEFAENMIQLRKLSLYRWRLLSLKGQLFLARNQKQECRDLLAQAAQDLDRCEDSSERAALARLLAMLTPAPDRDRYLALASEISSRNHGSQTAQEQMAFEIDFYAIFEGEKPARVLADRGSLVPENRTLLELALARAAWVEGRFGEARASAVAALEQLTSADSPLVYARGLALRAMAELAMGDWNQLLQSHQEYLRILGSATNPAFSEPSTIMAAASIAIGLCSTNDLAFFEGVRQLRARYAAGDSHAKRLIDALLSALAAALKLAQPEKLAQLLLVERVHLIVFRDQMKAMLLDGQIANFGQKPLLYELLKLFASEPTRKWTKEDIAGKIWSQESYDPLRHDQLIYVNISRLKKLIEPKNFEDSVIVNLDYCYAIHPGARVELLQPL